MVQFYVVKCCLKVISGDLMFSGEVNDVMFYRKLLFNLM